MIRQWFTFPLTHVINHQQFVFGRKVPFHDKFYKLIKTEKVRSLFVLIE